MHTNQTYCIPCASLHHSQLIDPFLPQNTWFSHVKTLHNLHRLLWVWPVIYLLRIVFDRQWDVHCLNKSMGPSICKVPHPDP
jgi:hypothetical protein